MMRRIRNVLRELWRDCTNTWRLRDLLRRLHWDERGGWFVYLLLAIIVNVIAYLLRPKPKKIKPPEVEETEDPVAEAGKPIPVIFGTLTKKELNILWFGDKNFITYKIRA